MELLLQTNTKKNLILVSKFTFQYGATVTEKVKKALEEATNLHSNMELLLRNFCLLLYYIQLNLHSNMELLLHYNIIKLRN